MKEPYKKGLATHFGPESCGTVRKDSGEALTGEDTGKVLSLEIPANFREPTPFLDGGRQHGIHRYCEVDPSLRGRRPLARMDTYHTGIGRARRWPWHMALWSAPEIYGVHR